MSSKGHFDEEVQTEGRQIDNGALRKSNGCILGGQFRCNSRIPGFLVRFDRRRGGGEGERADEGTLSMVGGQLKIWAVFCNGHILGGGGGGGTVERDTDQSVPKRTVIGHIYLMLVVCSSFIYEEAIL